MSNDRTTEATDLPVGMTIGVASALLSLDPDGGWDHEKGNGWPTMSLFRDLRAAADAGYVQESTAYGSECWRLTDEGMRVRKAIEAEAPFERKSA